MASKKIVKRKEKERINELKNSLEYVQTTSSIIFNVGCVIGVFIVFYIITTLITNSSKGLNEKVAENVPAEIQYEEILAGETFNKSETEYYVLFFDFDGEQASYYNTIISTSSKTIYKVDLGNTFNKQYASEETNKNAQTASELKVKEATLIQIKNNRNVSYTEGKLLEIKTNIK